MWQDQLGLAQAERGDHGSAARRDTGIQTRLRHYPCYNFTLQRWPEKNIIKLSINICLDFIGHSFSSGYTWYYYSSIIIFNPTSIPN